MQDLPETGFLLIDKPQDWTSFDVIAKLRGITGIRKIGHTGTLDPFATGLLLVAVGRASTKEIDSFMKATKRYEAEFTLGATTETLDTEAAVQPDPSSKPISEEDIDSAISKMIGEQQQVPPMFSAIKQKGKKLYELARAGKTVTREARTITISDFKRTSPAVHAESSEPTPHTLTTFTAEVEVSSGTYIRVIAQDLAETLGTTGYLTALRRTHINKISIEDAITLDQITRENWRSLLHHVTVLR